ncbi:MAG: GNAT family N-acetyltransferase [Phycisphaerales bacterium]|nr:GNAT family N-acetyltransferase [Phycisphaerales bacterium]
MKQHWAKPLTLEHDAVRLEPLACRHAAELAAAAASPDTFRYFSRAPRELTETGMREFIQFLLGPAETVPFCVVDAATGARVGITTYLDIRPAHKGLEIGWTWYAPASRGSRVNPASKLLLLQHAFDSLGAIRVCLKTDERNAASRAAILKLGASFEGILRRNIIMPDGFQRSTAMYSVMASEWPAVRERLAARL